MARRDKLRIKPENQFPSAETIISVQHRTVSDLAQHSGRGTGDCEEVGARCSHWSGTRLQSPLDWRWRTTNDSNDKLLSQTRQQCSRTSTARHDRPTIRPDVVTARNRFRHGREIDRNWHSIVTANPRRRSSRESLQSIIVLHSSHLDCEVRERPRCRRCRRHHRNSNAAAALVGG